jgi:catechol 2,3-dioxygenase-like lactoylglutathione lyase family enzyme
MNLNQVTVPVTDLARAAEFYQRLGLVQIVDSPPDYARFECPDGEATFSIERVERAAGADAPGVVVYFECEDLDARVAALERAGIAFDSGPCDQRWRWREARLRDPDGNAICLFSAGRDRRFPPWRLDPPRVGG